MTAWGQNRDISVAKSAVTLQGAECCENISLGDFLLTVLTHGTSEAQG